jgi:hypothetical protein
MTSHSAETPQSLWRHFMVWAGRVGLANKLAVALMLAAIGAGFATYAALTATPPFGNDPNTVTLLLMLDLALLLLLGAIIARRIVTLWMERRRGLAGSRLHVRLVAVFSLLAVAPFFPPCSFMSASSPGSANGFAPRSMSRLPWPRPTCTNISRRSGPMRWPWPTTWTVRLAVC